MTGHNLKNNLKKLKQITPDFNWKITNREVLMSQLFNEKQAKESNLIDKLKQFKYLNIFLPNISHKIIAKPIGVIILIISLIAGSGVVTVSAAKGSLPGDTLYSVKRTVERARVTLAFGEHSKAKVEVKLAKNRLNEFKEINHNVKSNEKKARDINIVVEDLKNDIKTVENRLAKVKKEKPPKEVVALAKIIDSETEELKKGLKEQQDQVPEEIKEDTDEKIDEAINAVEVTGMRAATIIVEKHLNGEVEISEDEVIKIISSKIEETKEKIEGVSNEDEVDESSESEDNNNNSSDESQNNEENSESDQELDENTENEPEGDISEESDSGEILQSADEALENIYDEASKTLTEAEDLLKNKDFSTVLTKIEETNELINEAEETISTEETVEEDDEEEQVEENSDENAESSTSDTSGTEATANN